MKPIDSTEMPSKEALWDAFENKLDTGKQISAGFIVRSKDGKYLLGRATFDKDVSWTVFKGGVEIGETLFVTAKRELLEESGIDIDGDVGLSKNATTSPIYTYQMKNKKVFLFLLDDKDGVLDGKEFSCSSFWDTNHPEIVEFRWFNLSEMEDKLFHSQRGLVKFLGKNHA